MVKITQTNIRTKKGKRVQEYAFSRGRRPGFLLSEINTKVRDLIDGLKAKNISGRLAVTPLLPSGKSSWVSSRLGHMKDFGGVEDLTNDDDYFYRLNKNDVDDTKRYPAFRVYVFPSSSKGGAGKYNNCFFNSLYKFYGYNGIPKSLENPNKIKTKVLGIEYNEMVDIKHIPLIENYIHLNINVVGDYTYQSPLKHPETCNLRLNNNHYELIAPPTKYKGFVPRYYDGGRKGVMVYKKIEGIPTYYDGETFYYDSGKFDNNDYFIWSADSKRVKNVDDLPQEYTTIIDTIEALIKATDGFVDMYKTGNYVSTAKYHFYYQFRTKIQNPDPIEPMECEWISNAVSGGIVYNEPGTYQNAYHYDINSSYPYIMTLPKTIPYGRGTFKILTEKPSRFSLGIYRCKISIDDKYRKLFRENKNNYYTDVDLNDILTFGGQVELIQDGSPNALIYEQKKSLVKLFGNFVKYFYDLKCKEIPGAKGILNCLWGAVCGRDYKTITIQPDTETILNDEVYSIVPHSNGLKLKTFDRSNLYKYAYARMMPFILAYGRLCLRLRCGVKIQDNKKILLPDQVERIKYIHTDGFIIADEKPPINVDKKLGGLKLEKQGKVIISNKINVKPEWI
jgi:hypothetical protein